jgi:hypothetical protein
MDPTPIIFAKRLLPAFAILLTSLGPTFAQAPALPKILGVQVGFKPHAADGRTPTHKVGLWTPVAVRIQGGANRYDNDDALRLVVECEDSEDCLTLTRVPVILGAGEEKTAIAYVKPGQTRGEIKVSLEGPKGLTVPGPTAARSTSNLGDYLYLSLGAKLEELAAGLTLKERKAAEEGKTPPKATRFALYENEPANMPERWLGYDGVDLVILNTSDAAFTSGMLERRRLAPLLTWVAYGGRLIVPMHAERMPRLAPLLGDAAANGDTAWPTFPAKSLVTLETWSRLQNKPFPARGRPPVPIIRFDPARFGAIAETQPHHRLEDPSAAEKPLPLIARVNRGFGSITFIAFPLDSGGFAAWSGQAEFFRALVDEFGPRYMPPEKTKETLWGADSSISDWGAQLQRDLDNFDVPSPSFGTVAFFMLAYILLVSALDFFLLRRVVGKLEATWVTLPLMVLGVSLAAYSIVNSPADRGIRVNQIDLLDLDLSGALAGGPIGAAATTPLHGSTFFAVRSDAIRIWDVGLREPAHGRMALAWFGRADDGPGGMGRAGGYRLSPKSYRFDERGFPSGVPFAFRATKAFFGEWLSSEWREDSAPGPAPLLSADLVFHPREFHFKVSGTLVNHLPFDLDEADLFVFDRVYPIAGGLKKGEPRRIEIKEIDNGLLPGDWRDRPDPDRPVTPRGTYDPGAALKNVLFHERLDDSLKTRNHLLRRLDWSWRLRDDPRLFHVPLSTLGTREAILVGRAKFQSADAKAIDADPATQARVTLQSSPDDASWPGTAGHWARDTFVRAIVPVRPQP